MPVTPTFQGAVVRRAKHQEFRYSETFYPAGTELPAHSHSHWYLCFVRRGCYEENVDGQRRFCQPFTVAVHPAGETHSERFLQSPTYSFNVEGPGEWQHPAAVLGGDTARVAAELYRAFRSRNRECLQSLSWELLAQLDGSEPLRREPSWLRVAREYLQDHSQQSCELSDAAQAAGVKPTHLATAFRRVHGCTAGDYLRRIRVQRACQQLARQSSLADVALSCGFYDQSHFTRTFHEIMGLTPAAYRELL